MPGTPLFDQDALVGALAHTNLAIMRLGSDGAILAIHGGALQWLGNRNLIGQRLADIAEQPQQVLDLLTQATSAGSATGRIQIRNTGANFIVDTSSGMLKNPETAPIGNRWWNLSCVALSDGIQIVAEDLTEQIAAISARDEVLKGMRGLLWHADIDATGESLHWDFRLDNEAIGPIVLPLNIPPGLTWGQVWVQSRHPDDAERMNRVSTEALLSGAEKYSQTFRCYAADGSIHWLREDVQVIHVAPGRWRLIGICTDISELQGQEQRLREFEILATNALDAIMMFDTNGLVRYANPAAATQLAYRDQQALIGLDITQLLNTERHPRLLDEVVPLLATGWRGDVTFLRGDQTAWFTQTSAFAMVDDTGNNWGSAIIASDLSRQYQAEQERQTFQEQLIYSQQAALRELSTPLIPLADGLIVMPLVGTIDAARAQQVMEILLEGIARLQAETAILDITGVKMVDTQVANSLLRVARAAQLLEAQVILTGISAEVAQSLVQLGADLGSIVTLTNLQAGIAYAMRQH
ncbi:MAG: PAS domain S-box protein [Roseiflexaceae bacterium]|nr:PAS domain S-box protein [Roseiflexaceae bacterium]